MDLKLITLLVISIAVVSVTGCIMHSPDPAGGTFIPTSLPPYTPTATTSPGQIAECTGAADCVPAECCHPSRCISKVAQRVCTMMCTASCEGPLDCGAGTCGCVKGTCSLVPASSVSSAPEGFTGITIKASPQRYSPIMSSTPGIGLEPVTAGFSADNASFAWKATYGQFLSWNFQDFKVNQLGDSVSNHGEKLYWSFIDKPSSTTTPVWITVTAKDIASERVLGSSTVTLGWEGNYSVTVNQIE
jgi:hypothetical protein